ncbi:hypothetical protein [Halorussus ruber]|uniref:hypothetical protein n=1 Tax=Halorussus ruber TaxID=1126238 RepID=UPI0010920AE1|nr:hypothetical protein [Halorussus ruber]
MSETVESKFTVEDIMNNDIWLKDLERGLTVAVEASGMEYSRDIRKKIDRLSEGDTIAAELESRNSLRTIWAFEDIEHKRVGSNKARV